MGGLRFEIGPLLGLRRYICRSMRRPKQLSDFWMAKSCSYLISRRQFVILPLSLGNGIFEPTGCLR